MKAVGALVALRPGEWGELTGLLRAPYITGQLRYSERGGEERRPLSLSSEEAEGPNLSSPEVGKIIAIDLKVGDRVLFGKWSGTEVKLDGVEYLIMKESDIMGVIEQTAARKKAA